jgi:hypothetical protein
MEKLIICPICRAYVFQCSQCRGASAEGDDVVCIDEGSAHVCEDCLDDYLKDQHTTDFVTLEVEEELK